MEENKGKTQKFCQSLFLQNGEVLPLKIVTYTTVSISLVALLITFILLVLIRTLRSNLHSIHKNLVAALFFSELVFLIGINQTENPVRVTSSLLLQLSEFKSGSFCDFYLLICSTFSSFFTSAWPKCCLNVRLNVFFCIFTMNSNARK